MKKISEFKVYDFEFVDLPQETDLNKYSEATAFFIDTMSKNVNVKAIYQLGEVSVPGMSDLDFLIVLSDEISDVSAFIRAVNSCTKKYPYLIMHYPLVISHKNARYFDYLFPAFSKIHKFGEEIAFEQVQNKKIWDAIILVDYINFHWPREFTRFFLERKMNALKGIAGFALGELSNLLHIRSGKLRIPVRVLLSRLNSLKYPLILLKEVIGRSYLAREEFTTKVSKLRKEWFSAGEEKYNLLLDLLKESVEIVNDLISEVEDFFRQNKILLMPLQNGFLIEKEHVNVYLKSGPVSSDDDYSWNLTNELYNSLGCPCSVLPLCYQVQRKYLDEAIHGRESSGIIDKDYLTTLKQRYSLFAEEIVFLNKNKVPFKSILKYDYLTTKPAIYLSYLKFKHKLLSYKLDKLKIWLE